MDTSGNWFGQRKSTAANSRRRRGKVTSPRLAVESLESRTVLSGFSFLDFSDASSLNIIGDAATTADNRLRLTPAAGGMEGAAWYAAEKEFVASQFSTTFQFQMTENVDAPGGSDGLVFIIQNTSPTYLAGGGGTLGYHQLANSVAIEFDTFQNSEVNDPSPSHISIHTNGTGPNSWEESLSIGSYSTYPALIDDAAVHTARISFDAGILSVYLDDLQTPKLAVPIDLGNLLNLDAGRAWVGFTSTTGGGYQNHDILNWSFDATVPTTTLAISDASQIEGTAGTTTSLAFTVARSGDTSAATTVEWTTIDDSATAGSGDYVAASGILTFEPGEASQSISVTIHGDASPEDPETFIVKLSNATNGFIADANGTGTILNDEVVIAVSDAIATEGDPTLRFRDEFVKDSTNLTRAMNAVFGPDGNLYVSSIDNDSVLRYDGASGAFMDIVVPSGAQGLDRPWMLTFGPDDRLYVAGLDSNNIVRWDPATGAVDTFIPDGAGLWAPKGIVFDAAGSFYVSNSDRGPTDESTLQDQVVKFSPDGTFLKVFVERVSGGLDNPNHLAFFGSHLYVTNTRGDSINRYDATTGAFVDVFVGPKSGGLDIPTYLRFGPDGYLYVSSQAIPSTRSVLRYNGSTGAFVDVVVPAQYFPSGSPQGLEFDSIGNLYVAAAGSNKVLRFAPASQAVVTISLSAPSALPVSVAFSTANGSAMAGTDYSAASGAVTFAPGQTIQTVAVPTFDDAVYEGNEGFVITLSDPSPDAAIIDGQGIGTIFDNDPQPTKFYVVNDATTNVTYEYGPSGAAIEDYSLDSGNSAPRGAASTTAGDKVWVVDANRNVYVYDVGGTLLGSWTAGSLAKSATVQGIATDGTDIWIVDAKSDKVFKYAGAASRLSGSQNAASSFSLNSGNRDPSDLVVRGSEMWVVNNSSTDKVFKYSLSGALAGSWTISSGGGSPTGITIDPAGGTSMWIVDSNTARVYQFDGATTRISGSDAPEASFALAAGNTNPQGIADPPASGAVVANTLDGASVPLELALIDRVLSDEDDSIDLADSSLPLSLAVGRRLLETGGSEAQEVDRWYASFSEEFDGKPSRRSAELDGQLDGLVELALAE